MKAFPLWTVCLIVLFAHSTWAQSNPESRVEWIHDSNLSYVSFERNPDTSSVNELINLYCSDYNGTTFYETISSTPVHYDFRISPYSTYLRNTGLFLLEMPDGLAFAKKDGEVIWQTAYREIKEVMNSKEWLQGSRNGGQVTDVFRYQDQAPTLQLELKEHEYISYEGGFLQVSGYEQPTRIYDQTGELVLEEEQFQVRGLATDEARFFYLDNNRFTRWIADANKKVIAELPKSTFNVKGQGDQMMVQTGAFDKYWIDLSGNRVETPFVVPFIPGEIDVLRNCGEKDKIGVYFHQTDVNLPCEFDYLVLAWRDTSVLRLQQHRRRVYLNRQGEVLYDSGPSTTSRYLGGDFMLVGGGGNCKFMRMDGRMIVETDIYPSDASTVAHADYIPDQEGGKLVIGTKYGNKVMVYDTSGALIYTRESTTRNPLNWGTVGEKLKISTRDSTWYVSHDGEEAIQPRYRYPEYIYRDGQLKYVITSEIYPDRVDVNKNGPMGLLDGISSYLLDAKTDEVIVSSRTGMDWIDDHHLLLYFGTTYGIVRVKD